MIERFVKLGKLSITTVSLLRNPVDLLTDLKWVTIKVVCAILGSLDEVTTERSAEKM